MAGAALAAATERLHASRLLQRAGPAEHRRRARLHRRAGIWSERGGHSAMPAGFAGTARRYAVEKDHAEFGFLQRRRMSRPALSRSGASPDASEDQGLSGRERLAVSRLRRG